MSVLDLNKAIYFSFCQGNWSEPGAFYDEWGNYGENHIWDINQTCTQTWEPPDSGCHAVVCLGYDDTDPDPSKHYWIMVNSWGISGGGRPNGVFLVPMHMNYNCTISGVGGYAFGFEGMDVSFQIGLFPVAEADGPYTSNEGSAITFDGSMSSDDGTIDLYCWDWEDDGTYDDCTPIATTMHTYGDDYSGPVGLRVTDDECLNDTDTTTVTVTNVAPTVEAGPNQTVDEGDVVSFEGNFTDPGWLDTHTATWDFGDMSPPEAGSVTEENIAPDSTGNVTGSHAYGSTGVYIVTLKVTDDDGDWATDTLTVTVKNVPPTVEAGEDQIVDEGVIVYFEGNFTDPSWLDTHTASWNFGDGTGWFPGMVTEENVEPDSTGNVTGSHTYGQAGVYTVTLNVTDDKGGSSTDTLTVTVNNVPPTVLVTAMTPTYKGCTEITVEFEGNFTDPSWLDTHTAFWNFGDGSMGPGAVTEENVEPDSTGNVTGSHTYILPLGVQRVTLTVIDDKGGVGKSTYKFYLEAVGGELLPVIPNTYLSTLIIIVTATALAILSMRQLKKSPFFARE